MARQKAVVAGDSTGREVYSLRNSAASQLRNDRHWNLPESVDVLNEPSAVAPPLMGMFAPVVPTKGGPPQIMVRFGSISFPLTLPERLNPQNTSWAVWSSQVKRVLGAIHLDKALDKINRSDFDSKQQSAVMIILHACMPQNGSKTMDARLIQHADEVWTFLERQYQHRDQLKRQRLFHELLSIHQHPSETVEAWTARLASVINELNMLGATTDVSPAVHKATLLDRTLPILMPGQHPDEHAIFVVELSLKIATMEVHDLELLLIGRDRAFTEQMRITGKAHGRRRSKHGRVRQPCGGGGRGSSRS